MIRLLLVATATLWASLAQAEIDVQEVTSPGGIEAWLVESHDIPFTAVEILIRGGANLDRPGKRGAVHLMTGLIEEGSGDMTAQEFQTARESLAASFGFDVYDDSFSISARFLSENRDEAVALLKQAITDPTFDDDAVERVRAQVLSIIRSDAKDPSAIAGQAFDAAAFGDHPYGSPLEGTIDSVTALSRDDLVTAHEDVLTRGEVYVGAAGDITAEELGLLVDDLLSGLPAEGPEGPGPVEVALAGDETVIDFPTPQTTVLFGHEGIDRDDPDFIPAYILNEIFGGNGLDSRLMTEVREKRGLTYGIYTYLVSKDDADLYLGSVNSANSSVAEAIEVIRDEWAGMAEEGVTAEELDAAKTYLTGAYPLRFDGNGPIADILVGMQYTGLPASYIEDRNAMIEAVTLEDINRVAGELLDPEGLHFVVVGQPEGLAGAEEMDASDVIDAGPETGPDTATPAPAPPSGDTPPEGAIEGTDPATISQ